jgi:hypothetical protein
MFACARVVVAGVALIATPQSFAQRLPRADPDWPCQQVKTSAFSLASVWAGPDIDLNSQDWRSDPDVVDLATRMSQRRVPIKDVEKAISDLKAKRGGDAHAKLLEAFGAAFQELTRQRSQILSGLDRFGRTQRALADRIRAENEVVQADENKNRDERAGDDAAQRLQWDLRVYDERRQIVSYVCESPALVEQRIGAIARAVQQAL